MGSIIQSLVSKDSEFELVGAIDHYENIKSFSLYNDEVPKIIIDFSNKAALDDTISYALKNKCAIVIGTTGFDSDDLKKIKNAANSIPIFFSANYSLGINLVNIALKKITQTFSENGFSCEIVESHHRQKKDVPSGTALMIANNILDNSSIYKNLHSGYGNDYIIQDSDLGIHSIRSNNEFGMHEIIFESDSEVVTIKHKAKNRDVFAKGAILAAKFIVSKKNGLYNMDDLLNKENN